MTSTLIQGEMMDNELWKPVKGYEGFYEVSNLGSVRSVGGRRGSSSRFLKYADTKGYDSVALSVNNKPKTFQVHRLVMDAFVGHKPELEVNHKDGNKKNNALYNLEWTSHQGNMEHALFNNLVNNKGEKHGMHKLSEKDAIYIKNSPRSNSALANEYLISLQTVSDIKLGRSWKHLTLALHEAGELPTNKANKEIE